MYFCCVFPYLSCVILLRDSVEMLIKKFSMLASVE